MYPRSTIAYAACIGMALAPGAEAQGQSAESGYVSREEYESLKRDFESMQEKMQDMSKRPLNLSSQPGESPDGASWLELKRSQLRLDVIERQLQSNMPGDSNFHLAGFAFTRFMDTEGMDSSFTAKFVPIILWEINDRLFFESELEFELESEHGHGSTEVELEYAHGSYIINDYMTFGAGKFLTPFGVFAERLHPQWINKLPNMPLAFAHDGLVPFSSVGVYLRGGFPVKDMKINYAFYLTNGPALNTEEEEEAGLLEFENFNDINNNKAIGGRIGVLPIPELEIGYSFLFSGVNATGDDVGPADALLQGIDVSYVRLVQQIAGMIDLRFEYVHSDVDTVTFDPDGLDFGPLTYNNKRDGFYFQAAYRPTLSDIKFLRDFEFVGRYEELDVPSGAPDGQHDHERWTIGVNYYLAPNSMFKVAYQSTEVEGNSTDAFMAMFVIGF